MNLINQQVIHRKFGEGRIVDQNERYVFVDFGGEKPRQLACPMSFGGLMTAVDADVQAAMAEEAAENERQALAEKQERLKDYAERYRNLPYIGILKPEVYE